VQRIAAEKFKAFDLDNSGEIDCKLYLHLTHCTPTVPLPYCCQYCAPHLGVGFLYSYLSSPVKCSCPPPPHRRRRHSR
jgi:hypothetical protein